MMLKALTWGTWKDDWVLSLTESSWLNDDYFGKARVEQDRTSVTLSIEIHSISNNEWRRAKWIFNVIYTGEYEIHDKLYKIVA